ncbi:MAG TPA: dihydroorotase [Lentisphaeria bacterium]|nr:dihydroorotase [Lentisphaeria bacterium]
MADFLTLFAPLDMHLHLRDDGMLRAVGPASAADFAGAVIMPNLVPPVDSLAAMRAYRDRIEAATADYDFTPFMTLFFRDYSDAELAAARDEIIGIKLYPAGVTTNSEAGVKEISGYDRQLSAMQELDIPLLVHGESHGFVLDREQEFLAVYRTLAKRYPRLRIVMEHITTAAAAALLDEFENLYATVTLHHLIITLNDVAGGLLQPHLFCKPIAKRPEDRDALLAAALGAHPKLMFGSDSAPHPRSKKEACGCAAGVFSAPTAVPLLADLFDRNGALASLQAFIGDNARHIYRLPEQDKTVRLVRKPQTLIAEFADLVVFGGGETIAWSVEGA